MDKRKNYIRAAKPFVNSLLVAASDAETALTNLSGEELQFCLFLVKQIDHFLRTRPTQDIEKKIHALIFAKQRLYEASLDTKKKIRGVVWENAPSTDLVTVEIPMREILIAGSPQTTLHSLKRAQRLAVISRFRRLLNREYTIQYRAKDGTLFRVTESVFRLSRIEKEGTDAETLFVTVSSAVLLGVSFGSTTKPYLLQPDATDIVSEGNEFQREFREAYVLYIMLEKKKAQILKDIEQTGGTHIEFTSVIEKTVRDGRRGRAKEHVERVAERIARNFLNSCGISAAEIKVLSDVEFVEIRV